MTSSLFPLLLPWSLQAIIYSRIFRIPSVFLTEQNSYTTLYKNEKKKLCICTDGSAIKQKIKKNFYTCLFHVLIKKDQIKNITIIIATNICWKFFFMNELLFRKSILLVRNFKTNLKYNFWILIHQVVYKIMIEKNKTKKNENILFAARCAGKQ